MDRQQDFFCLHSILHCVGHTEWELGRVLSTRPGKPGFPEPRWFWEVCRLWLQRLISLNSCLLLLDSSLHLLGQPYPDTEWAENISGIFSQCPLWRQRALHTSVGVRNVSNTGESVYWVSHVYFLPSTTPQDRECSESLSEAIIHFWHVGWLVSQLHTPSKALELSRSGYLKPHSWECSGHCQLSSGRETCPEDSCQG